MGLLSLHPNAQAEIYSPPTSRRSAFYYRIIIYAREVWNVFNFQFCLMCIEID